MGEPMQQECKCPKCGTVVNAVPQEPEFLYRKAFNGGLLGAIVGAIVAALLIAGARTLM
jgi:hypothetical protein